MAEESNKVVSLRGEPVVTQQQQEVDPQVALRADVDKLLESYKGKTDGVIVLTATEGGACAFQAAGSMGTLHEIIYHLEAAKHAILTHHLGQPDILPPKS